MFRIQLVLTLLLVMTAAVHALEFKDASTCKSVNSAIAKANGERVCIYDSGQVARSVVFVVNENFRAIEPVMLSEIKRARLEVGGCKQKKLEESESFPFLDSIAHDSGVYSAEKNEFNSVKLQNAYEYCITVDQYNLKPKIAGVSSLRIRLIDAREFLGKDTSIVIISRTDRWEGRAQIPWTRIPLFHKVKTSESLVGKYEVRLVERVVATMEAKSFALPSGKGFAQLKDSDLLAKIMAYTDWKQDALQNDAEDSSITNPPPRGAEGGGGSEPSNP